MSGSIALVHSGRRLGGYKKQKTGTWTCAVVFGEHRDESVVVGFCRLIIMPHKGAQEVGDLIRAWHALQHHESMLRGLLDAAGPRRVVGRSGFGIFSRDCRPCVCCDG